MLLLKNILSLFVISSFLLAFSCNKNETPAIIQEENPVTSYGTYPGVDQRLWPYFQKFENEATLRGFDVDLVASGITGEIIEIQETHVAGQCNYYSFKPNHVILDASFWQNSGILFREFIVFHELGHCYLLRDHKESAFSTGICQSIMRSGTGSCFDNYNSDTRKYYLDELFFESQGN